MLSRAGIIGICCSPCSWLCPSLVEIRLQKGPSTARLCGRVGVHRGIHTDLGDESSVSSLVTVWSALDHKDCTVQPGPPLLLALLWRTTIHLEGHSSELFLLHLLGAWGGVNQNISLSNTENSSISPIAGGGNSPSRT